LRSGVGLKERLNAMNKPAPLFSPPPVAPPGFGFACATQRLIIASFRGLSCEGLLTRNLVEMNDGRKESPHPPFQLAAQVPDDLLRHCSPARILNVPKYASGAAWLAFLASRPILRRAILRLHCKKKTPHQAGSDGRPVSINGRGLARLWSAVACYRFRRRGLPRRAVYLASCRAFGLRPLGASRPTAAPFVVVSMSVRFHPAFAGLLAGWQYSVTFSIETMAESLPILGPRSLILETETLAVPNSNASAQAWAVHHWVYGAAAASGGAADSPPSTLNPPPGDGPAVVSALTVGWRNVAQDGSTAYNVYVNANGAQTPLTQTPVTGETVTLTGTDVKLPWCNEVPGGGTETLSVVAVDSTTSTSVALPPGSCYDNQTGIAWIYSYQYFATDHLGTVRAVYDGETGTTQTFAYEPFGVEIAGAIPDTCDNTHRFTGQERDLETGNDYMHFRFFSSNMGRFQKPDSNFDSPLANPQGWNLYTYVKGNPVNFNDPTGHMEGQPWATKGVVRGGIPNGSFVFSYVNIL